MEMSSIFNLIYVRWITHYMRARQCDTWIFGEYWKLSRYPFRLSIKWFSRQKKKKKRKEKKDIVVKSNVAHVNDIYNLESQ